MGAWEGLSEQEIKKTYPVEWAIWNNRPSELDLEGRETQEKLQSRVVSAVRRITAGGGSRNIAVVTHVSVIRVLQLYCEGKDLNDYRRLPVPANGSVLEFDLRDNENNSKSSTII